MLKLAGLLAVLVVLVYLISLIGDMTFSGKEFKEGMIKKMP